MPTQPVQTKDEALLILRDLFSGFQNLSLLIAYGSAAEDKLREDSDIDVAIALDKPLAAEEKLEFMYQISKATLRESDIADLRTIGGLFLHQVLSRGTLVINNDPKLYSKLVFESLEYIDLIPHDLTVKFSKTVWFRNIAVHQHEKIDCNIVHTIIWH